MRFGLTAIICASVASALVTMIVTTGLRFSDPHKPSPTTAVAADHHKRKSLYDLGTNKWWCSTEPGQKVCGMTLSGYFSDSSPHRYVPPCEVQASSAVGNEESTIIVYCKMGPR